MSNITLSSLMILIFVLPIVISFYIWAILMSPQTYFERFISMIFGTLTGIIIFVIEIWLVNNVKYSKHY